MFDFLVSNLKKGVDKIVNNPQLIYTVVIAVFITGSFVFVAERFISIANDAQERLVNVRIGSLQDAFVTFAGDRMDDSEYLNTKITDIIKNNATIESFRIVEKKTIVHPDGTEIPNSYVILASNDPNEVGKADEQVSFLYTLAVSDSENSLTVPLRRNGERLFETARSITDQSGNVRGVVFTLQTLSLADTIIEENIRNGRVLLLVIILLIIFLLFRHSRIIDYMDLYKKLKGVDQLKDDFISMASHELRTPLSAIRGYTELSSEAPEISAQTKEYLARIDISAKDLDSLVADMLDVSRIEQGRMSFDMAVLNPSEVVIAVVESLTIPATDKGLRLSFDKSHVTSGDRINVDSSRLKQILVNLVGNAIKYTLNGEITVRQYTEGGRVYIRVSDTGMGMTEEQKSKLFGKFYRIKSKEREDIRGTGLGLWITAQIIKEMNGDISVESIKGVGSHFIISFPLVN